MYIYSLIDPETKKVRYIGKTMNFKHRLIEHLSDARKFRSMSHKENWIRSLLNKGLMPIIELVEKVPDNDWEQYERYWIAYYRSVTFPEKLTNSTGGGEDAPNMKGVPKSDGHKLKIKLANLGKKRSPEAIENNRKAQLGKKRTRESVEKGILTRTGFKHSVETKKLMSEKHSGKGNPMYGKSKMDKKNLIDKVDKP